jgi:hypothetical protein
MQFFLGERAETHGGPETLTDLLNGPLVFVPSVDESDQVVLLNPESILVVSVLMPPEQEGDDSAGSGLAQRGEVETTAHVVIEGELALRGIVSYTMPVSKRRLQDFLNTSERFLALTDGGVVHLINKRRITKVLPD